MRYSRDIYIKGFILNIWGENPHIGDALGFVKGLIGDSGGDFPGVCFGVTNSLVLGYRPVFFLRYLNLSRVSPSSLAALLSFPWAKASASSK